MGMAFWLIAAFCRVMERSWSSISSQYSEAYREIISHHIGESASCRLQHWLLTQHTLWASESVVVVHLGECSTGCVWVDYHSFRHCGDDERKDDRCLVRNGMPVGAKSNILRLEAGNNLSFANHDAWCGRPAFLLTSLLFLLLPTREL